MRVTQQTTLRHSLISLITLAGGLTSLSAEPALAQAPPDILRATLAQPNEKTPEVSTEELRRILADKSAMVFDARPPLEYAISHIPEP